jgi:hypothetical protein
MFSMLVSNISKIKIMFQLSRKESLLPLWISMMMKIKLARLLFNLRKSEDMIICPKLKKRSDSYYILFII